MGNSWSYISNAPAIVHEGHDLHLLNQLKHPFLNSCESDFLSISRFPCHSSSRTALSSFSSTHCDGMRWNDPSAGSVYLRCRVTPSSSANSLNISHISITGSLFSYNLTASLTFVTLYSVSTARKPLQPFSLGRYNRAVEPPGCFPPFSAIILRASPVYDLQICNRPVLSPH